MRKTLINQSIENTTPSDLDYLDLEHLIQVEISSESLEHSIESARQKVLNQAGRPLILASKRYALFLINPRASNISSFSLTNWNISHPGICFTLARGE